MQIVLDMQWEKKLEQGSVIQVSPLVEPLLALHGRLEDEMDARGLIHLATGRRSRAVNRYYCGLFTAGALVSGWWEALQGLQVLILDEVQVRSLAYSELFQMLAPLVERQELKVIIMSATLPQVQLQQFFGEEKCNKIIIPGRLFHLYRFELEPPSAFECDQELAQSLVELCLNEAVSFSGGLLVFVRGQALVELVASKLTDSMKSGQAPASLKGWRVLQWFSRADSEAHSQVFAMPDEDIRCIVMATEGLGVGKTCPGIRIVISSCDVNRLRGGMLKPTCNSKSGVLQEGGRVGRHPFLGAGRHIIMRPYESLPDSDEPEIMHAPLHRVSLRLLRDRRKGEDSAPK